MTERGCCRIASFSAGFGFLIWAYQAWVLSFGRIEQIILLAALVYLPMGLRLVCAADRDGRVPKLFTLIVLLQPLAALCLLGMPNPLFTLPWLCWTGLMALHGLQRIVSRSALVWSELAIDVGFTYIAMGGGWLTLSQFSPSALGFVAPIPLLTAIHFHYTGFILSLYLGLIGRLLPPEVRDSKRYYLPTALILASVITLAMGITFSRLLEVVSVLVLILSLIAIDVLIVRYVRPAWGPRLLLWASLLCLLVSLSLSAMYVWGRFTGQPLIDIPQMLATHGMINAFGFSFLGLLALSVLRPQSSDK